MALFPRRPDHHVPQRIRRLRHLLERLEAVDAVERQRVVGECKSQQRDEVADPVDDRRRGEQQHTPPHQPRRNGADSARGRMPEPVRLVDDDEARVARWKVTTTDAFMAEESQPHTSATGRQAPLLAEHGRNDRDHLVPRGAFRCRRAERDPRLPRADGLGEDGAAQVVERRRDPSPGIDLMREENAGRHHGCATRPTCGSDGGPDRGGPRPSQWWRQRHQRIGHLAEEVRRELRPTGTWQWMRRHGGIRRETAPTVAGRWHRRGANLPAPGPISGSVQGREGPHYDFGCTPNANTVSAWNFSPGRSTVDGKFGWFGESGKCCVSRPARRGGHRPCRPCR